jgi:hypothetical protein
VRAAIASANLRALGLEGEVVCADAADVVPTASEVVFLDPARRDDRGRVFDPEAMSPPWSVVEEHLSGRAVVKTLPGIPHALVPDGVEAEWVSDGGDLVEACLWGAGLDLTDRAPRLKAALVARDVGTLTVKKRGVDVVPEVLVRRLRLKGSQRATVVLTRVDDKAVALLVDPLPR